MTEYQRKYISISPDNMVQSWEHAYSDEVVNLTIGDSAGKWHKGWPSGILSRFPNVTYLSLHVKNLEVIVDHLPGVEGLSLFNSKLTSLTEFPNLKSLRFAGGASQKIEPLIKDLKGLSKLDTIELNDHYGRKFPKEFRLLDKLRNLIIGSTYFKKRELDQVIETIAAISSLKVLKLGGWDLGKRIGEEIQMLDFLDELHLTLYKPNSELSPYIAGLEKAKLVSENDEIDNALSALKAEELTGEKRVLAFAWYCRNFARFNELAPQHSISETGTSFHLPKSIKGWSKKTIKEELSSKQMRLANDIDGSDFTILSNETELEDFVALLKANRPFISESAFKYFMEQSQGKWLLSSDVEEEVEENVFRLLASNTPDNIRLAFEIVKGGGVNKEVLSLIAAIALSHPDKKLSKEAEKLYLNKASDGLFQAIRKHRGYSLRRSSNTVRKVNLIADVPEIDFGAFLLMHHIIAGSNPQIQDVHLGVLDLKNSVVKKMSPLLVHFEQITSINLDTRKDFDWESLASILPKIQLESLFIANCHFSLGQELHTQSQMSVLDISYNEVEDISFLSSLNSLVALNLAGLAISDFSFLAGLTKLQGMSLASMKLRDVPKEVKVLKTLRSLSLKQNKITTLGNVFDDLKLEELDLSANQLGEVPKFKGLRTLEKLNLRSNGIQAIDSRELSSFLGGAPLELKELDIGKNELSNLEFKHLSMPRLFNLNIEDNVISQLDDSVIEKTQISILNARKNSFEQVPIALKRRRGYRKLILDSNAIKSLPDWLATITIEKCQLNKNQISYVHPDFEKLPIERNARLYWNVKNNPYRPAENPYGGMYW